MRVELSLSRCGAKVIVSRSIHVRMIDALAGAYDAQYLEYSNWKCEKNVKWMW
jgi:hypothetical protein